MAKKIRVGVLGMTHDHIWSNLRDLKASSLGELVAAADPNQELLEKAQSKRCCPRSNTEGSISTENASLPICLPSNESWR